MSLDLTKFYKYNYNLQILPDGTLLNNVHGVAAAKPLQKVFMNAPQNFKDINDMKYYFELNKMDIGLDDYSSVFGAIGQSNSTYLQVNTGGLYNYNNFNNNSSTVAHQPQTKSTDHSNPIFPSPLLIPITFTDQLDIAGAHVVRIVSTFDNSNNVSISQISNFFNQEVEFKLMRSNALLGTNMAGGAQHDPVLTNCKLTEILLKNPILISFSIYVEKK